MADDETTHPASGIYAEPPERLTRMAAAMNEMLESDPEYGDDIRSVIMIRDESGGSGTCLHGYPQGEEVSAESLADIVTHLKSLFGVAGIDIDVKMVTREDPDAALTARDGTGEERQRAVLTVTGEAPDPRMKNLCTAVKGAVEETEGLDGTRLILIMDLGDASTIMHHGYEGHHAMAHGLFTAFQRTIAMEGGHVAVIPVMDSPN